MFDAKIFKAYDIRGVYHKELDEETAYKIGQAYVKVFKPKKIAVGCDVRTNAPAIKKSLINGLIEAGVDVVDIGIISTDMIYFSVANYGFDGGITVTASHNPKEYIGFKMVRENSISISSDSGLYKIRDLVVNDNYHLKSEKKGKIGKKEIMDDYIEKILSFIDINKIKPIKIVLSANFGLAGVVAKKILAKIPAKISYQCLDCQPNGEFPKGRPDPLIPERRKETSRLVKSAKADLGVAWDADADRCFFFDDQGNFVHASYITTIIAEYLLKKAQKSGDKSPIIIHDTRIYWPIKDKVTKLGAKFILTKAGHAFIKERLRKENALFGAETSAHYYFRDNFYTDNGMIPFLIILEIISQSGKKLSQIITSLRQKYFLSEEINSEVKNTPEVLAEIEKAYADAKFNRIDGLDMIYPDWRASIRSSNTEPLVRLNVESLNKKLMQAKRDEILALIEKYKS